MNILVVDDSKTNLMMAQAYLEGMGHTVITTTDPFECSHLFLEESPDLVILDVVMEGMDGYDCARAIRKISNTNHDWVPIIFLSAQVDDESIAKGIEAGGDDYLTKPYSEVKLAAKIKAMSRIATMRQELAKANEKLNKISLTDGLTNIGNRRAFDIKLESEAKRLGRLTGKEAFLSIIILDIDYFKKYNDAFGHQAGDECLKKVAKILKDSLKREAEEVFRYGGEEFVAILPHASLEEASKVAERFRFEIEREKIPHAESSGQPFVTISLGVAGIDVSSDQDFMQSVKTADEGLYEAKENGRNQCVAKEA